MAMTDIKYALTIPLSEPIHFGLDEIVELKVRKPTGRDVLRHGIPVLIRSREPLDIEFDVPRSMAILADLTNLPVNGTLENLSAQDTVLAVQAIAPFFIPGASTRQED